MTEPHVLLSDIVVGESPRWHGDRLWFADWGAKEIVAVDPSGAREVVVAGVESPTFCFDFLPDGRLLVVSGPAGHLLTPGPDGTLVAHTDLRALGRQWNDIVVDGQGRTYVNDIGFDLMAGADPRPGTVALVTPDGAAVQVADGLGFPNGMAVTADNTTLIVAESHAGRLTAFPIAADGTLGSGRVWADLGDAAPDGICVDAEGAVWYADVPHQRCVRVREGGEVLQTVPFDRGCFACVLGGGDRATLFVVAATWRGPQAMFDEPRTGRLYDVPVTVPGAGWP